MIDLNLNSVISIDKISNTKLDFSSFTSEQNSFAKVFETASKSFEATKKSLDNMNKSEKTVQKEKPEVEKKDNTQKEKISDKKQDNQEDKKQISDEEKQNSTNEVKSDDTKTENKKDTSKVKNNDTSKEDKIKQQDEEQNTSSETEENVVSSILSLIENTTEILTSNTENTSVNDVLSKITDYTNLSEKEISLLKTVEDLNKLISANVQENETTETLVTKASDLLSEQLKNIGDKLNLKTADNSVQDSNITENLSAENNTEQNFLEKLLFGKRQEMPDNKLTRQNAQDSRETSEKLLNDKVQTADLTQKVIDELKTNDNKLLTQNPLKSLSENESIFKNHNKFLLNHEGALNLHNVVNQDLKTDSETSLSDIMTELDIDTDIQIDVTSSSADNQTSENNQNEYNFNSSSFSDLNSHVTKLSLNKTADFSKVMNAKTVQQDNQILNQVKEATTNTLSKGTTSVSMILKPASLGRVHVNLVSQNGVLTAQFTAQSQQTADALNRNIETLKQNLVDQGVKIAEVSVKVQETSQSDGLLSNDSNSFEDKLGQTKEQHQSKHNHKSQYNSELADNNNYFNNNSTTDETDETISSSHIRTINQNNDLGLYNNMGRTL